MIKELLGRARIGVTASAYPHVRLRFQRQGIGTLNEAPGPADDSYGAPPGAAVVR